MSDQISSKESDPIKSFGGLKFWEERKCSKNGKATNGPSMTSCHLLRGDAASRINVTACCSSSSGLLKGLLDYEHEDGEMTAGPPQRILNCKENKSYQVSMNQLILR